MGRQEQPATITLVPDHMACAPPTSVSYALEGTGWEGARQGTPHQKPVVRRAGHRLSWPACQAVSKDKAQGWHAWLPSPLRMPTDGEQPTKAAKQHFFKTQEHQCSHHHPRDMHGCSAPPERQGHPALEWATGVEQPQGRQHKCEVQHATGRSMQDLLHEHLPRGTLSGIPGDCT